ncbi:VOC family protein [Parapedomonas caeni]
MAARLTHIALHVRDLDASIAFYRDWCGMHLAHDRIDAGTGHRVVWLAQPGQDSRFVIVLIPGGHVDRQAAGDFSHLGIALDSRDAVEATAGRAAAAGLLAWPVTDNPPPVGTYCGVCDPDGRVVEFSFGQPLGQD